MAKIANTFTTYDAVANREELADVVDRTLRDETPFYSKMAKGSCSTTYPEWLTDELDEPGENFHPEGDEYTFDEIEPVARHGNPTQIFRKSFVMSNTQDVVDNAGRKERFQAAKLDKGIEMRRDVEFAILSNTASVRTDPRRLGGLPSWLETNVSRGVNGINGGFNEATGLTVAATNGDQRALTKTLIDNVMALAWSNGARVDTLMMAPYVKRVFTTFQTDTNVPQFQYSAPSSGGSTLISNVTMYNGDFGTVTVMPNYIMGKSAALARNVFFIDFSKVAFLWLRRIKEDPDVAKTGDAKKHVLIGEGTLQVKNERGLGVVADVFGLTAST